MKVEHFPVAEQGSLSESPNPKAIRNIISTLKSIGNLDSAIKLVKCFLIHSKVSGIFRIKVNGYLKGYLFGNGLPLLDLDSDYLATSKHQENLINKHYCLIKTEDFYLAVDTTEVNPKDHQIFLNNLQVLTNALDAWLINYKSTQTILDWRIK